MKYKNAQSMVLQWIVLCSFFFTSIARPQSACNTCDGKIRIRGSLSGSGHFSGLPLDSASDSGTKVYLANKGTQYTLSLSPPSCGDAYLNLTTCDKSLYYKKKELVNNEWVWPKRWQLSSSFGLFAHSNTGCDPAGGGGEDPGGGDDPTNPGGGGPTCGCAGCTAEESCMCCCYAPGSTSEIDVYTSYSAWTVRHEYVNTDPEVNPYWQQEYDAYANQEGFLGISSAPSGYVLKLDFKDTENTESVVWNSETQGQPKTTEPDRFLAWSGEPEKKVVDDPPTLCNCTNDPGGNGTGTGTGSGEQSTYSTTDEVKLIAWNPPESPICDVGASGSQGPSAETRNFGESLAKAPLRLEFGLGRNTEGAAAAAFFYSTELDSTSPLDQANFKLIQPFHDPADGVAPIQIISSPAQGAAKLIGSGILVTETRSEASVTLCFYDTSLGGQLEDQLVAVHTLQHVPETADHDPGIIHTETRNGQVMTWHYYGKSDAQGGRSWKEIDSDGNVRSGIEAPTQGNIYHEQNVVSKMIDGVEVITSNETNQYKLVSGKPYLIQNVVDVGGGQLLTTQYDYYWNWDFQGEPKKLKWRIDSDGSWIRLEYNPTNGEVIRTYTPWLSSVTHPDQATVNNSRVVSLQSIGALESWETETAAGQVVSRSWRRQFVEDLDPVMVSTWHEWNVPKWRLNMVAVAGFGTLSDLVGGNFEDTSYCYQLDSGEWNWLPSQQDFSGFLPSLMATPVEYDEITNNWFIASFSRPQGFALRRRPELDASANDYGAWRDADGFWRDRDAIYPELTITLPTQSSEHTYDIYDDLGQYFSSYTVGSSLEIKYTNEDYGIDYIDGETIHYLYASVALAEFMPVPMNRVDMIDLLGTQLPNGTAMVDMDTITGIIKLPIQTWIPSLFDLSHTEDIEVEIREGVYAPFAYPVVAQASWERVWRDVNPLEDQLPINLDAFNGVFDVTKIQRFTQDYHAWTGHMELRNAGTSGANHGELRRSVDSMGRVSLYSYEHGLYDAATGLFDWTGEGQARKVTTRTYAANPATFELLAEDPVYQVTMSDYQGLTRVEQTWHGVDLIKEVIHDYDPATRERLSSTENGTVIFSATRDTVANNYTTIDADGTVTVLNFGENGAYLDTRKLGHAGRFDVVSSTEDAGFVSHSITSAGGLKRRSSTTRDLAGRTVSSTDENGLTTTYVYELGGRRVIETRPDGGTRITENHLDGRLKTVTGTAVVPEFHDYNVDSDGNLSHTVYFNDDGTGNQRSPRWRRTVTNGIGWLIREESPAPGGLGVLSTVHHYNEKGQLVRTERSGQKDELTTYDLFGRVASRGLDLNGNGTLDHDFSEPVTSTEAETVKINGQWWEKLTTIELASAQGAPMRSKVSRRLLSGALYEAAVEQTSDGLLATRVTTRDPASKTVTTTQTSNRSALSAVQIVVNGLLVSQTNLDSTGASLYEYDPLERLTEVTDAAGITRRTVFDDLPDGTARSQVLREELRPAGEVDFQVERSHTYHPQGALGAGRLAQTTQADGSTLAHAYDLYGRRIFTSGTGTYPVRHEYDAFGDLWKMHTWRSGSPSAEGEGDVTTWTRDPASGKLLDKTDALSQGASYTYDPASGRLLTRAWARQSEGETVTATYAYDDAGRLEGITYSDGTPGVVHTYHPDGRLATTSDAAGLRTYHYEGPNGELSGESITGGLLDGAELAHSHHPETHRRTSLSWAWGGQSRTITQTHDSAGRLSTVSAFGKTATYAYDPVTGWRQGLAYSGAGALTGTWTHDTQGRLSAIHWQSGLASVSGHEYTFDAMNRRATALREDAEQWRYAYNPRGEVTSGVKARGAGQGAELRTGLQFGYGYDLIGNRVSESVDAPGGAQTLAWSANAANQIEQRETPDARWVLGRAHPEAALAVTGGGVAVREGAEFAVPVTMTDAEQSEWRAVSITASREGVGRNGGDVSQTRQGKLWLPASPESFTYDADGNLTADGRWSYEWDAENRLKAMQTLPAATVAGVPAQRLEFAYDAQSRRIRKAVYQQGTENGELVWQSVEDLRYLYDGWNVVAEFNLKPETSNLELVRSYAWGIDLSGTEQGAGGVGGLLLVEPSTINPPPSTALAPCYDGNGNIIAYVNLESGAVLAKYDYDPFGKPVWTDLSGTGELPPFRFSTKYEDAETGLAYYGFRYYSPELGRWINRDPIEEDGGVNLYGMVGNDAINQWDVLGMMSKYDQDVRCTIVLYIGHSSHSLPSEINAWVNARNKMSESEKKKYPAWYVRLGCGTYNIFPNDNSWPEADFLNPGRYIGVAVSTKMDEKTGVMRWKWEEFATNGGLNPDVNANQSNADPNSKTSIEYQHYNQAVGYARYFARAWDLANYTASKMFGSRSGWGSGESNCCKNFRVKLVTGAGGSVDSSHRDWLKKAADGTAINRVGLGKIGVQPIDLNDTMGFEFSRPQHPVRRYPMGETATTFSPNP